MILAASLRCIAPAAVLMATLTAVCADEDSDHDLARDLHERGEIRSFEEIARIARQTVPGDIVSVTLQQSGPHWTYAIQIVDPVGHRLTLDFDAESAKLLDRSPAAVKTR
jgi:uncharacterized membrane protein YkoI